MRNLQDKLKKHSTVKLGNKEWFDKEKIGILKGTISRDQFTIYFIKIRNFWHQGTKRTKKFLIAKFDCTINVHTDIQSHGKKMVKTCGEQIETRQLLSCHRIIRLSLT